MRLEVQIECSKIEINPTKLKKGTLTLRTDQEINYMTQGAFCQRGQFWGSEIEIKQEDIYSDPSADEIKIPSELMIDKKELAAKIKEAVKLQTKQMMITEKYLLLCLLSQRLSGFLNHNTKKK